MLDVPCELALPVEEMEALKVLKVASSTGTRAVKEPSGCPTVGVAMIRETGQKGHDAHRILI